MEDAKAHLTGRFPSSVFPFLSSLIFVWSSGAFVAVTKLVNS